MREIKSKGEGLRERERDRGRERMREEERGREYITRYMYGDDGWGGKGKL